MNARDGLRGVGVAAAVGACALIAIAVSGDRWWLFAVVAPLLGLAVVLLSTVESRDEGRMFFNIGLILVVLVTAVASFATREARGNTERRDSSRSECIAAGASWVNGNCIQPNLKVGTR